MIETMVAIIGAGPAGVAAAMQLRRCGVPLVLLERERVGGLLWEANFVENYPGFPRGISGPQLARRIAGHARRLGVQVSKENVLRLECFDPSHNEAVAGRKSSVRKVVESRRSTLSAPEGKGTKFHVITERNDYLVDYVIVASGTMPVASAVHIPIECTHRVHSSIRLLRNMTGKSVVVVGAGDAAFDYALTLAANGNHVTILNRKREPKCLKLLCERALSHSRIIYRAEWSVTSVAVNKKTTKLVIENESGQVIEADFLLFAIGRNPQVDFLPDEFVAHPPARLFLAGDVKNGMYRQAAIAAGDGLRAAMQICSEMECDWA